MGGENSSHWSCVLGELLQVAYPLAYGEARGDVDCLRQDKKGMPV